MIQNLLLIATLLTAPAVFAATPKCANQAVESAVTKNFKRFGASTNSCGATLLSAGEYRETYLVCVSDETDPSEWVVVINTVQCKVEYAGTQSESETPTFDSLNPAQLLKTQECSADQGLDGKVHCQ